MEALRGSGISPTVELQETLWIFNMDPIQLKAI